MTYWLSFLWWRLKSATRVGYNAACIKSEPSWLQSIMVAVDAHFDDLFSSLACCQAKAASHGSHHKSGADTAIDLAAFLAYVSLLD